MMTFLNSPIRISSSAGAIGIGSVVGRAELRQEIGGAHDRPGHQLREERHVERHVERVAAHLDIAAIDVGHVRDAVKREERDPDRQQDLEERQLVVQPEAARQLVRAQHEKVEILEDAEQPQMQRHRAAED